MKRILCLVLALVMMLAAVPAFAERSSTVRTSLSGASSAARNNISLAAESISGTYLPYGARFSFNDIVGPRSARSGYERAENGRGSVVVGGGVAQCATTIFLTLEDLRCDVEYTDFYTYGSRFTGNYVSDGSSAVMVDYDSGYDFSFTNFDDDMYIEMWTTGSYLYCSVTTQPDDGFLSWGGSSGRRAISASSIWIDGSDSLYNNILHAASSINDTVLSEGDRFSFNDTVGPRTERYGYEPAVNGRGVKVVGGGVAQVASAIWLAIKNLDDIAILEKSTYGSRYNQSYVSSSNDAILTDYNNGTDFSFRNTGSSPIRIATYVEGDMLRCEIYRD